MRTPLTHPAPHPFRRIYAPIGILAVIIAIAGFWASYFGPLTSGVVTAPGVIHLHAAVFVGWLALVISQAWLAAAGKVSLHIKVGNIGMIYGVALVLVGLVTAFSFFVERLRAGHIVEAQRQLFVPLTDLMGFAPFLAAAWFYRRRPEIHKRLIVVATTILLIAAVHRMPYFGSKPPRPAIVMLIWLSPIYLCMIYDFFKQRRIHPVYLIGIAAIVYLKFFRVPLFESELWARTVRWLTEVACPACRV